MGKIWKFFLFVLVFDFGRQTHAHEGNGSSQKDDSGALLLEDMDFNVKPGENFYTYANGGWLSAHPSPPPEFSRYGTFNILDEETRENLRIIAEEEVSKPSGVSQVGDMYASAMNEELSENAGLSPLHKLQKQIEAVECSSDVMHLIASLHEVSSWPSFDVSVGPDSKHSSWTLLHLYQGGLGLPDRDFYLLEQHSETLHKYEDHLVKVFRIAAPKCGVGAFANPEAAAKQIIYLETELANSSLTRVERRNPETTYNKVSMDQLPGGIDFWSAYQESSGFPSGYALGDIIVDNLNFFNRFYELMSDESLLDYWKTYLHWNLLRDASPYLTKELDELAFDFYQRTLLGQKQQEPRWKRVLDVVGEELRTPMGKLYVARHFSTVAKRQCLEMVELLRESLRERIQELKWMSSSTKVKALEKLDAFRVKIGFPDQWVDFSNVKVSRSVSYIENKWSGARARWARRRARVNKAVNKELWEMSPQTVNAYYHPALNEIVFPAAILQSPFFVAPSDSNPLGDPSISFGGIGAVIGHEMTHGYDDSGRKYNAKGNLVDWWNSEDASAFADRAKIIISQYNEFEMEGQHVNGKLTQGENIADLGGVKLAYTALKKFWSRSSGGEPELVDGFTTYQRFFLSWARIWRNAITKEAALQRLIVDPHSPGKYRVNGPLVHLNEFYEGFNVSQTDRMFVPEDQRCYIW